MERNNATVTLHIELSRKSGQTSPDFNRVCPAADLLKSLLGERASQNGGGRCAVARLLVGVVGNVLHQLRSDVLILVLQLDRLRHRHSVLRDFRTSPALLEDNVPALQRTRQR